MPDQSDELTIRNLHGNVIQCTDRHCGPLIIHI